MLASLSSVLAWAVQLAGWSYLLTGITQCYLTIMKISEHAKQTARISGGAVVLNIILNAVFIYGWFGLPAMGVRGAALATLIARIVELTWAIASSWKKGYIHSAAFALFPHQFGCWIRILPGVHFRF